MEHDAAVRLVAPAIERARGTWADLGAGSGTFTRALAALLGDAGRVIAVERDAAGARALERLARQRAAGEARIEVLHADFTGPLALPPLDGVLLANALHFVPAETQAAVLRRWGAALSAGGRLALVEYENRAASRWVPFPVSFERFATLAREIGGAPPERAGDRRSAYGGTMYAAYTVLPARAG